MLTKLFCSCVLRVLSIWLDHHPSDFEEPPLYHSLHKTINFLKNDVTGDSIVGLLHKAEELLNKLVVSPFVNEGDFIIFYTFSSSYYQ